MQEGLRAGVRFFQYRCKTGSRRAIHQAASRLAGLSRNAGALFVVNDHADIAVATSADGVHLGQDDLPLAEARKVVGAERIIGISTHSVQQASAAEKGGADYIGFGPVFATRTKDAGAEQGLEGVCLIKKAVALPVIAIGGINHGNVREVIAAGADGVAVLSAVLAAAEPEKAAAEMVRLVSQTGRNE